jgi:hypothetical protein
MSKLRSKRGKKESSQHPRGSRSYNNTNFRDKIYLRLRLLSTTYVEKEGILRRKVLHTTRKQSYRLTCSIFYDRGLRSGSRDFSYLVFGGSTLCRLLERRLSSSRTQRSPGILTTAVIISTRFRNREEKRSLGTAIPHYRSNTKAVTANKDSPPARTSQARNGRKTSFH